jgi:hypothetical protein
MKRLSRDPPSEISLPPPSRIRAVGNEIDDPHGSYLTHAMDAGDALFEDCRVSWQVHVHQGRGMLQIEAVLSASVDRNTRQAGSSRNRPTSGSRFSDGGGAISHPHPPLRLLPSSVTVTMPIPRAAPLHRRPRLRPFRLPDAPHQRA